MRVEVFALDDTSVQVVWDGVPAGGMTVEAGPRQVERRSDGGPGAAVVDGLAPGATVGVTIRPDRGPAHRAGVVTTLVPPPGRRLSRFATLNDVHIGACAFGTWRPRWNDDPADPHPERCLRAAIREALAWGAEAFVVKGDSTQEGLPNQWARFAAILAGAGRPVLAIEGNHDTHPPAVDGTAILARHGIALTTNGAGHLDLPGVRLVAAPTAVWHTGVGRISREVREQAVALVGSAGPGCGAVVAVHHYPQRLQPALTYPSGVPGRQARSFLDALAAANPATVVLAGHTHRHRRRRHGSLVVAEVGSPKDFPGTWGAYTVYEGGIMQTVRRVSAPDAIAWTESGRRVLGGLWAYWASGLLDHRCWSHTWPPRPDRPADLDR